MTRNQAIRLAVRDLKAVGIDVSRYGRPVFCTETVEKHLGAETYGFAENGAVYLREDMTAALTYKIFLHEVAHLLGLEHTKKGLMAPTHHDTPVGAPSPRQRKRWVSELARLVTRHRIRMFIPLDAPRHK